ncbi:transcription antiterminator NusB [Leptolyngbya sp. BL0902]|uniref:transcription antitermination factor NusB n=1 Tax=Leptolyngbya sp. BL0902 TaxID=1115757 RepID=UPI0018E71130|nr:transcription antitermination factor NusB [Leptolyngbya sp. BL0902]QQE65647.1 transcription antiterminator NusB [Leptolyngbya sp. BL0902]
MQARRMARELALLGLSQLPEKPKKLQELDLDDLLQAAVKTLAAEAKDALETASDELKRGSQRLVDTDLVATDLESSRAMVDEAIDLTQTAINRLAHAVEMPEFLQMTNQKEVRAFAMELLTNTTKHRAEVDSVLESAMVAWQLKRLARIDRDILRIAVVEMDYLGTPDRVAINEAVEIAKRYSGEEGFRFINGVLKRVVDRHTEGQGAESQGAAEGKPTPQ